MAKTSHLVYTDIFDLENVVQQTSSSHAKNILIDTLRDVFRKDRWYKYVDSCFGFPLTPSHLGLEPDAGLDGAETTRIFIGASYRYDIKFNPSVIVRNAGITYNPISFNQDLGGVVYGAERVVDAYGAESVVKTPMYKTLVGAWDQNFEIKVISESARDRDEITDIITVALQGTRRNELTKEGLFISKISTTGEQERAYSNDHLFMTSINLSTRTEWKVHIPISDLCERIAIFITLDSFTSDDIDNELDILTNVS